MGALQQAMLMAKVAGGGSPPAPSPHVVVFLANAEIESAENQIFGGTNNSAPDSGVSGAHGLVYDQAGAAHSVALGVDSQTFAVRVRCYVRVDANNNTLFWVMDGSTFHINVRWLTGGVLEVTRFSNQILATTSSAVMSVNTWHDVELYGVIDNTVGEFTLRVDGVIPNKSGGGTMSVSGVDTQNGSNAFMNTVQAGNTALDTYTDDYAVSTTNASLGVGEVETLMPDGDGHYSQLTPNSGSVHFDRVNQKPEDGDTTYLSSTGSNQRDSWTFENRSLTGTPIGVGIFWRTRRTSGSGLTVTPFLRIAGVDFDGSAGAALGGSYVYQWQIWSNNPATGNAWTDTEINALEIGVIASGANIRVTQVAMQVFVAS